MCNPRLEVNVGKKKIDLDIPNKSDIDTASISIGWLPEYRGYFYAGISGNINECVFKLPSLCLLSLALVNATDGAQIEHAGRWEVRRQSGTERSKWRGRHKRLL